MRKDITITAEARQTRGKNEARRLRASGGIPAVVYGSGGPSVAVTVDPKAVGRILHSDTGHNTIFNLNVKSNGDAATAPVMIVDWQSDPIKDHLLHVDLKRIDLTKPLAVKIPVHTQGDPKGVKQQGGLLELVVREIEIECLPDEIPSHFTVDVTELMIGQSRRASEVPLTASMKLLSPGDAVVAHVVALKAEEEATPAAETPAAAAPAEPEVIKKGKKEEEGAPEEKKKGGGDEKKKK